MYNPVKAKTLMYQILLFEWNPKINNHVITNQPISTVTCTVRTEVDSCDIFCRSIFSAGYPNGYMTM